MSELKIKHSNIKNSRKRKRTEDVSPNLIETASAPKQRRIDGYQPPDRFWKNLSKVWLTERALRELDRRNALVPRQERPVTRGAIAKWKGRQDRCSGTTTAFLSQCSSRQLEALKRTARHGGPDLRGLRGYRQPANPLVATMNSRQSASEGRTRDSTTTTKTRKSRPYDRNFLQHLIDNGIFPDEYEFPDGQIPPPPDNLEAIEQRLTQPRRSLSPSKFTNERFREFKKADAHAAKERPVTDSVIPIIEGRVRDRRCVSGAIPWTNLDALTDGTLVSANPDRYYGARPEQLDRRIRDQLSKKIVPSTQHDLPMLPNFLLAAKGPGGDLTVAERQAVYDGALAAKGMESLRAHGQNKPVQDNEAHTISSIYHGGQLKMYACHTAQPANSGGRPHHYMTQLNTWGMTGNAKTFREGAAAYRNARDWAKEERDRLIQQANERLGAQPVDPPEASSSTSVASPDVTMQEIEESQSSVEDSEGTPRPETPPEHPRKRRIGSKGKAKELGSSSRAFDLDKGQTSSSREDGGKQRKRTKRTDTRRMSKKGVSEIGTTGI
ncbi:MAG: hypothetical protein M1825_001710 [Sarcosagium campestre]|nr:MAG: hypothetical protein M1825_001710 [Sarcosagium campestre]